MLNLLSNYNHIFTGAQLGEIAMQFSLLLETGYIRFSIFIGHRSADIVIVFFPEVVENLKLCLAHPTVKRLQYLLVLRDTL